MIPSHPSDLREFLAARERHARRLSDDCEGRQGLGGTVTVKPEGVYGRCVECSAPALAPRDGGPVQHLLGGSRHEVPHGPGSSSVGMTERYDGPDPRSR